MKKILLLVIALLSFGASALAQEAPPTSATTRVTQGTRGVLHHYTFESMLAAHYRNALTGIPTDDQLRAQNPGQYQARMGLKAELEREVRNGNLILIQSSLPTGSQVGYWYRDGTHVAVHPDVDGVIRAFFSGNWQYITTAAPAGYWHYCLPDPIWTECSEWEGVLPDGTPAHFEQEMKVFWGIALDGMDKDGCGNPEVGKVPHITVKVTPRKPTPLVKEHTPFFYIERSNTVTQVVNQIPAARHSVGGTEATTVKTTKETRLLAELQPSGGGFCMTCALPPGVCPGGPPGPPVPPLPPGMTSPPNDDENRPPRIGKMLTAFKVAAAQLYAMVATPTERMCRIIRQVTGIGDPVAL